MGVAAAHRPRHTDPSGAIIMNGRLRTAVVSALAIGGTVAGLVPAGGAQAAFGPNQYGDIVNSAGRGCVDVRTEDGINTDGAHVQNYHCTGSSEQKWNERGTGLGDGSFFIVNKRSGKCLDGSEFWSKQWSCGYVPQQEWKLRTVPGGPANTYQLINNAGSCLTLTSGNGADHQTLSDDKCHNDNWYGQLWEIY
jgi:Ricin-type beta-trefoil lectin domain-like